jgi:hypothetical protein
MGVEENLKLMKTLDDAWNAGPGSSLWETFRKRLTENVAVYWPGQPEPTRGIHNHDSEAVEFFKIFPDNHLVNNPYHPKILFEQGDYTCSVAVGARRPRRHLPAEVHHERGWSIKIEDA